MGGGREGRGVHAMDNGASHAQSQSHTIAHTLQPWHQNECMHASAFTTYDLATPLWSLSTSKPAAKAGVKKPTREEERSFVGLIETQTPGSRVCSQHLPQPPLPHTHTTTASNASASVRCDPVRVELPRTVKSDGTPELTSASVVLATRPAVFAASRWPSTSTGVVVNAT